MSLLKIIDLLTFIDFFVYLSYDQMSGQDRHRVTIATTKKKPNEKIFTMAFAETLKELGLSPNEARIYEALLELGESSVTEIATHTNIHRRNVYDAVNRLVDKGIITPVIEGKESRYAPIEPGKFLEMIEEKRIKLEQILPEMQKLFAQKKTAEGVFVYRGIEGFKNVLRDTLKAKEFLYTIGGKSTWLDPYPYSLQYPFVESWLKETKRKNIKLKILLDATAKDHYKPGPRLGNSEFRFLPKEYSSPALIDIYNDRVNIYLGKNLNQSLEDLTIFMMISERLAQSYKQWFQFMWDRCGKKSN